MGLLQEVVHKLEIAVTNRYFRYTPALLAVLLVALVYDLRHFRNLSAPEAMDAAQLGRRIAEGKGYTTLFVRPLSIYLIEQANRTPPAGAETAQLKDPARLAEAHPDIANPPVYPVLLAGFMQAAPFNFTASNSAHFWSSGGSFWRYQPDFLIALFNQLLFGVVIALTFLWAHRLFDAWVAWTAAIVLLGTELLWQFSVSGHSTLLLLLVFMGLVWCITILEAKAQEPGQPLGVLLALAATVGLLVGLGTLTRYAFGWIIVPTVIFIFIFAGSRRAILCLVAFLVFAAVLAPWITRNYQVCGAPLGTATYHVLAGTPLFPGYSLERSLGPNLEFFLYSLRAKLLGNLPLICSGVFANLGGGWVGAFFLVGLMVGFRRRAVRRMRYFLLFSLGVLMVVQALGRSQSSEDSPQVNGENVLVLLLPLVVVYGVSLFFTLLDGISFPSPALRSATVVLFGGLACLPMLFSLFSRTVPVVYPPYHPLLIQQTAAWMEPDELMMSDVPWAVAWYGHRQSVWLTLNVIPNPDNPRSREDFYTINRDYKPVRALYLTQKTTDGRYVTDWLGGGKFGWGEFMVDVILKSEVPADFPLHEMPDYYLPEQVFLADQARWR